MMQSISTGIGPWQVQSFHSTHRSVARLMLAFMGGLLVWTSSHAASPCIEDNGTSICSKPQVTQWVHSLCDEAAPTASRYAAWCKARGGSYLGLFLGCTPTTPDEETNLFIRAQAFSQNMHVGQACVGTDTGWGQTVSSNNCYNGGPTFVSGTLTRDYRTMSFDCGEVVRARRERNLTCPRGTQLTVVNSKSVCLHKAENTCSVGNPLMPAHGRKVQAEDDTVIEGFEVQRFYSSTGSIHQYAAESRPLAIDQVWRDSFDLRLQKVESSPFIAAAVSFPNGTLQYFRHDGSAVLPIEGQANAMSLRLVGGNYVLGTSSHWYTFDTLGHLTRIDSGSSLRLQLRYADGTLGPGGQPATDAAGQPMAAPVPRGMLIEVMTAHGRKLRLDRDVSGRLTRMTLPNHPAAIAYHYSDDGRLTRVAYPDGMTREYRYNEPGLTSGQSIPDALTGIVIGSAAAPSVRFASFGYGADGRALSSEHAGGVERVELQYAPGGGSTTVRDALGSLRTLGFLEVAGVSRLSSQSQPAGSGCAASTMAQGFDSNGNVASRDHFDGVRQCLVHDLSRNVEQVRVDGLSSTVSCAAVTANGATLPVGARKSSTQWHPDWHLITRLAEPGRITTNVYNGQPDPFAAGARASCAPASALLPDGKPVAVLCRRVEQATIDADGALGFAATLQAGVAAREQRWTYNERGQVLTHDGPRSDINDTTVYEYHTATNFSGVPPNETGQTVGDLKQVTNPVGHATRHTLYDRQGLLRESVDGNGIVSSYTYDARQRPTSVTVGGQTTLYEYGPTGLLRKLVRPDGSWVLYEHDAAQRLVRIGDNLGSSISYTLDRAGNRVGEEVRDASGAVRRSVQREIDALGRVQQLTGRE